jgi:hypothetical protein
LCWRMVEPPRFPPAVVSWLSILYCACCFPVIIFKQVHIFAVFSCALYFVPLRNYPL